MKREIENRLDDAARAGWLYYIAGKTQDDIAQVLGISRQSAQRLVALAVSEKLVRVWLDHPIARCLELGERLATRHGLRQVVVTPSDRDLLDGTVGLAEAAASELLRWLRQSEPKVVAIGTGRTLKATIERLPPVSCPQHRIVSLTGNLGPDGAAAYYNVIYSMAQMVEARHFPFPLPVLVASAVEKDLLHEQALIRSTLDLASVADVAFVGIGEMDVSAPLFLDGFISRRELSDLISLGAVGEICGWIYDAKGALLEQPVTGRTASAPIPSRESCVVMAVAKGPRKLAALRAAMRGDLINGLITDELTAEALLASDP